MLRAIFASLMPVAVGFGSAVFLTGQILPIFVFPSSGRFNLIGLDHHLNIVYFLNM